MKESFSKKASLISLPVVCALGPQVLVFVHVTHYSPVPLSAYSRELTPTNQSIFMYFIIMVLLCSQKLLLFDSLCAVVLSKRIYSVFSHFSSAPLGT